MAEDKEVPFGATEKEVRDDVPIMASEGEYVIPANVVKYIGLEKIEKMVNKAKEELARIGESVEEGDGMVEDEELPFDLSELTSVPHMAEGGIVDTGFDFPDTGAYTGVKEYKDKNGNVMFIPYMHGQPLFQPPEGYTEGTPPKGGDPESTPNRMAAQTRQPLAAMDNSAKENRAFVDKNKSPLAGNPNDWTVQDFVDFGRNRDSAGNKAIKGMISVMPGGKLAMKAREMWLDKAVSSSFDKMLETGTNMQGGPLSPEERTQLLSTREHLKSQMSNEVGIKFSPMESLTNAVQRFTSFTSPTGGRGGQPASSVKPEANKMLNSFSRTGDPAGRGRSDDQYSGGGYGLGSDLGRDPSKGPSSGSMASGGLYADGGYVTRRKNVK